jgi:hypothetical protein
LAKLEIDGESTADEYMAEVNHIILATSEVKASEET